MSSAKQYLSFILRRIRLEAAVTAAQQRDELGEEQERLLSMLDQTLVEESAYRTADQPIAQLAARLQLRAIDEALLWTAVALEIDPVFSMTINALGGDDPRYGITARLVAQLFRLSEDDALDLRLDASHVLVETNLLESSVSGEVPDTMRPFRVNPRVISFLEGQSAIDPLLRRAGGLVELPAQLELDYTASAREVLRKVLEADDDVIVCIEGIDGVGRRTMVGAVARELGREAIYLDLGRASGERNRFLSELRSFRRECWLRGAVPIIARLDAISRRTDKPAERLVEVAGVLEAPGGKTGPIVVTMTPGTDLPDFQRRVVRIRVDSPSVVARSRMWGHNLFQNAELPEEVAIAVQHYALTPGGIERSAANARMLSGQAPITASIVRSGVAAEIQERFSGLATRVNISQNWDDLVLPPDTLDDVKSFTARAEHATKVYDDWGFRRKLGKGLGLAALFSGPPGTGKTMVAGLIAKQLGLEVYMVDLAQVVSKWVGETEKQLGKIFDAASMGHVVLLFDEADSLFAKRTDVKSSNDRYANLEVNYLLTRLEAFNGVAIMTTNLEGSIDPAVKRRLAAEVNFFPPEREERERLWRTMIPSDTPVTGDLDFWILADKFKDMAGGHIRNAVLRAAFLAAANNTGIVQDYLVRAAQVEYRAMGKVV